MDCVGSRATNGRKRGTRRAAATDRAAGTLAALVFTRAGLSGATR